MTPIVGLLTLPYALLTGNSNFLYVMGMWVVRVGIRLAGVRIEIVGRDKLNPMQTYIYMSNHVSNIDPPVLIPLLPNRTSVLVKKELFRIPILGLAMRVAHLVPVDRDNREAAIASMRSAADVIRSGLSMTVFPEGTRSPDGRLQPLKKGSFYMAMDSGCPIVPITLVGTHQILPKGKMLIAADATVAKIIFHEPILPSAFAEKEDLIAVVREAIASGLPAELDVSVQA
jgi:1-acyl-sn-glycerol-3-phosphate acyltransferase